VNLRSELQEARAHTRAVADDLRGEREFGPLLAIVNPPRWELGHVGWFQEFWCLRQEGAPSILPNADALYNSATVPHDSRWSLPLPSFAETLAYRDQVLEQIVARNADPYFVGLAVRHERMHAEAFHYTRQTLGLSRTRHPVGARDIDRRRRSLDSGRAVPPRRRERAPLSRSITRNGRTSCCSRRTASRGAW
jgi:iron(II)-dependent oxidoreductase